MADDLIVKIGATSKQFKTELDRLKKKTKDFEGGLAKGAKVSAAAFATLGAAIGVATAKFSNFEKGFTDVVTLLDKSSFSTKTLSEGVNELKNGVLALGADTGESFATLNKGLFDIVSATGDAENAISTLTVATELAQAGATDTSIAVDGLTSAMNSFNLEAEEAGTVAQKFFLAQKGGKTTVEELATGFGLVGATAKEFGVSLDELLASVSAVTLGGVKTRAAYTGLKATLANIAAPTADAAKEAKRLGIAFDSVAIRKKGLKGFFDSITTAANFNKQSLEKLFGSIEAKNFVFALAGSQAKSFNDQLVDLNDTVKLSTAFQEALETKQNTTDKSIARLKQSFNAVAILIGEQLAPAINKLAGNLATAAKWFINLSDKTKSNIATFLKWGAIVLASTTTLLGAGLAFIKISRAIRLVSFALKTGRLAALSFTAALTGGLSLIIGFLPEIISGIKTMLGLLSGERTQGLDEINKKLDVLKTKKDKLIEGGKTIDLVSGQSLSDIDKAIEKLEELKKKKEEAAAVDDKEKVDKSEDLSKFLEAEKAKNEALLAEQKEFAEKKAEQKAIENEQELVLNEEFNQLTDEQRALFTEEEIAALQSKVLTKKEIEKEEAKDKINRDIKNRNDFARTEAEFGVVIAKADSILKSKTVTRAKAGAAALSQLQQSENSKMAEIGKAAARVQIGISTAEGSVAAYKSLAGIPFVGPALGVAAAGAVIAFGAEQQLNVGKAQAGGVVPNGLGGARDRIPMLLEPGELVVPKALAPDFIQTSGRPDTQASNDEEEANKEVIISIEDDAAEMITAKQRENSNLSIGVI